MGLSLGNLVASFVGGGMAQGQIDLAGSALGVANPRTTAVVSGISSLFGPAAASYAAQLAPAFQDDDPDNPVIWDDGPQPVYGGGGVTQVALPAVGMINAVLASAIAKLAQTFGITAAGARTPLAYASRIWAALSGWAAKNPGLSMISLLTGVGLTAQEAAHFLAWGATKKKRRRRSGITASQLRTTRRTMRKIVKMYHQLPHRSSSRTITRGGPSIIQAR